MFTLKPSRKLRDRAVALVGAAALSVALAGCSGSEPEPSEQPGADVEADAGSESPSPATSNDDGADDAADSGESGAADGADSGDEITMDTEGVETACDAVFLFTLGQSALVLGPTTGGPPLTQSDVDEVFGVLEPYVPQFSDDLASAHSTYLAAATEAIGKDVNSFVAIFERDDVVKAQQTMSQGLLTECRSW